MKEEVSGMGRPNSRAELCAWVLGLMGAFFLLFGGAVLLWDIPVGGAGPAWAFLPFGAALLGGGGGCALACLARRRSQARLRREGTVVSGTVRSVRHHIFVTWNTQSFVNVPGRNSPWSAVCGYTWGGRDYTVSTGLLWGEPQEGAEVLVWLDPDRPGRAFVDPDSVRLDVMG